MTGNHISVNETAEFLKAEVSERPTIGFFSGTGLNEAISFLNPSHSFDYQNIPNFPISTVPSHTGRMLFGQSHGHDIVVMNGRFHLYEGYRPQVVTFPVRVMRALGVETIILTNAAGGINTRLSRGDIMVIADHINLTGENPLVGPNDDSWGLRFPPMIDAYDKRLARLAVESGDALGFNVKPGIYAGLKGPSLETPAEIRFLKTIGADAVGFSTVQEVIAARHGGMRVLGLSIITNINDPDEPEPATLEEVIEVAGRATPRVIKIVDRVISRYGDEP
ncbi:MAG: purine-nucleoside phosphorylase [Desulfobacterales bacterium]|nr:purine-nucleoside phosphorylase [Desulfobacterales bacterium]